MGIFLTNYLKQNETKYSKLFFQHILINNGI